MLTVRSILPSTLLLALAATPTAAQTSDTLRLSDVQTAAERHDPRTGTAALIERAARLRQASIRAEGYPQFAATAQTTAQSGVPELPIALPGGSGPDIPHVQARAQVEADWNVFDGGRRTQRSAVETARQAEDLAGLRATLYPLREAASEAYFAALLAETQARIAALAVADLDAQTAAMRARAQNGAALDADVAALEAERLRARQRVQEAEAQARTARTLLEDLTGLPVNARPFALPPPDPSVQLASATARPELDRLARTEARAAAEAQLARTTRLPSVSVFGQAGVARPSPFEPFSDETKPFGLVGVRLRWTPFDYGSSGRAAALAGTLAESSRLEAEALRRRFARDGDDERATLERLATTPGDDARILELREEILRVARARLDEGVALVPDYVRALGGVEEARLVQARHRIERAQAEARLRLLLGR